MPPAPPSEADGRKVRTGAPQVRPTSDAELENARRASRAAPERPTRRGGDEANARGRLTVASATTESDRDRGPSLAAMRRRRDKKMGRNQQDAPKLSREVTIPEAITVQELASVDVSMVLYPLSAFRAMNAAALKVYQAVRRDGTQKNVVDTMQTRVDLYKYLDYHAYEEKLDQLFASQQSTEE